MLIPPWCTKVWAALLAVTSRAGGGRNGLQKAALQHKNTHIGINISTLALNEPVRVVARFQSSLGRVKEAKLH